MSDDTAADRADASGQANEDFDEPTRDEIVEIVDLRRTGLQELRSIDPPDDVAGLPTLPDTKSERTCMRRIDSPLLLAFTFVLTCWHAQMTAAEVDPPKHFAADRPVEDLEVTWSNGFREVLTMDFPAEGGHRYVAFAHEELAQPSALRDG